MSASRGGDIDVERRTALIAGEGPRLAPVELTATTPALEAILERMRSVNTALDSRDKEMLGPNLGEARVGEDGLSENGAPRSAALEVDVAKLPEFIRTVLLHPGLFMRHTDVGIELLTQGVLPHRERELAILRIGWLCQAPYEWGEHVLVAKKFGVTTEEVERLTVGSDAPGWSRHDGAVIRATEELYHDAMISDSTWSILQESYSDKQLIELPILVGQYQSVAYYQNTLRMRLHEGNDGLKAR